MLLRRRGDNNNKNSLLCARMLPAARFVFFVNKNVPFCYFVQSKEKAPTFHCK
jgi:hypothetical protein